MDKPKHDAVGIADGFGHGVDGSAWRTLNAGHSDCAFLKAVEPWRQKGGTCGTTARRAAGPQGPTEEEQCAVILSVICEELRADPKDIQIKSIRRL